ncbi:Phosphopantetheinyl transferase [Flavobacterium succinicans]|uniref:Phosphopantetheinyl transferase n=1 Tax=Flavobacterium succinicans TaxID=29536 RepID=A0A1I4RQ10_9FLAO|nr:4'-phosphopantetheinyl transferase superfamily protein [Flavobacterium succinicans]SFM54239.1 Phosphopantetheinyl transferase [Flavobacterium succinicans]
MPLYKTIVLSGTTSLYVWHITEPFSALEEQVTLNPISLQRLDRMKSQLHQRAFLSVRKLLAVAGYTDFDLFYDATGKPHLKDAKYISITHSHEFAAIIVSDQAVGIDIELQREKIIRIADKFVDTEELSRLKSFSIDDFVRILTVKWGAKEAIFKICNEKGISFKNHIKVSPFELDKKETTAILDFEKKQQCFTICFDEFDSFTLVYAFENNYICIK